MGLIEFDNNVEYSAKIKVVGVGGGGTNAVTSMVKDRYPRRGFQRRQYRYPVAGLLRMPG